jgi:uncharacterized membrane protein YbhN (UPF0104 family)
MSTAYHIRTGIASQWRLWLTVGFFLLILLYINHLDLEELSSSIINGWWKLIIMLPVSGLAYLSATIAWRYCMDHSRIPLRTLFTARHIGESLAMINPTSVIAGDLSKVLVLKKYNIDRKQGVTSVIISRVLIIFSGLLLSCLAFLLWLFLFLPQDEIWLMVAFPLIGILMVYIMWRLFTDRKLLLYGLAKLLFTPFKRYFKINKVLWRVKVVNALIVLKRNHQRNRLLKSWIFSIVHWVFGAAEFYILLLLLGVDVGFSGSLILEMGVTVIKNAGAFVPGQLGIEEMGNKIMLSVIGVTSPVLWILVSAFKRARQLAWLFLGGAMYIFTTYK